MLAARGSSLIESFKKEKFVTIFFSDNVEWSSKTLWKNISSDVKANLKQDIKHIEADLRNIYKKYLEN